MPLSRGYAAAAALASGAAWLLAVSSGVPEREAALALMLAWGVQTAAFVVLARGLERGRDATRVWAGGMAARAGALFAAWLTMMFGSISRDAAAVFGLGLVVLIILEAFWLATIPRNSGSNDK